MIKTERLIIRPWELSDAEAFYELTQDDGFNLFPITVYRQKSVETAKKWIEENPHKFAVEYQDKIAGMGGLTPWILEQEKLIDITYRLRSSAWGKGLGIELARGLVKLGFEIQQLQEITATITPDNEASKKIAEKIGLKFDKMILLKGVVTELYRMVKP